MKTIKITRSKKIKNKSVSKKTGKHYRTRSIRDQNGGFKFFDKIKDKHYNKFKLDSHKLMSEFEKMQKSAFTPEEQTLAKENYDKHKKFIGELDKIMKMTKDEYLARHTKTQHKELMQNIATTKPHVFPPTVKITIEEFKKIPNPDNAYSGVNYTPEVSNLVSEWRELSLHFKENPNQPIDFNRNILHIIKHNFNYAKNVIN